MSHHSKDYDTNNPETLISLLKEGGYPLHAMYKSLYNREQERIQEELYGKKQRNLKNEIDVILQQSKEQLKEENEEIAGIYPDGELKVKDTKDDGALILHIFDHEGRIIINFPYPVNWIGLTIEDAKGLIEMLKEKIRQIVKNKGGSK